MWPRIFCSKYLCWYVWLSFTLWWHQWFYPDDASTRLLPAWWSCAGPLALQGEWWHCSGCGLCCCDLVRTWAQNQNCCERCIKASQCCSSMERMEKWVNEGIFLPLPFTERLLLCWHRDTSELDLIQWEWETMRSDKKNMKEINILKSRHHRELPLEAPLSRAGVLLVCPDTLWSNASKQPGWSTAALTFCLFLAFWFSLAPQKCIYGIKALLSPRGCCTSFWGPWCCCPGGQAVPCSVCPSVKLVGEGDKKKGDTLLFDLWKVAKIQNKYFLQNTHIYDI